MLVLRRTMSFTPCRTLRPTTTYCSLPTPAARRSSIANASQALSRSLCVGTLTTSRSSDITSSCFASSSSSSSSFASSFLLSSFSASCPHRFFSSRSFPSLLGEARGWNIVDLSSSSSLRRFSASASSAAASSAFDSLSTDEVLYFHHERERLEKKIMQCKMDDDPSGAITASLELLALCKRSNYRLSYMAWKVAEIADLYMWTGDTKNAHACATRANALIDSIQLNFKKRPHQLNRAEAEDHLWVCGAHLSRARLSDALGYELEAGELFEQVYSINTQLYKAAIDLSAVTTPPGAAPADGEHHHDNESENKNDEKLSAEEILPHLMTVCNNFGAFCFQRRRFPQAISCFEDASRITHSNYRAQLACDPHFSRPSTVLARQNYLQAQMELVLVLSQLDSEQVGNHCMTLWEFIKSFRQPRDFSVGEQEHILSILPQLSHLVLTSTGKNITGDIAAYLKTVSFDSSLRKQEFAMRVHLTWQLIAGIDARGETDEQVVALKDFAQLLVSHEDIEADHEFLAREGLNFPLGMISQCWS